MLVIALENSPTLHKKSHRINPFGGHNTQYGSLFIVQSKQARKVFHTIV